MIKRAIKRHICLSVWILTCSALLIVSYLAVHTSNKLTVIKYNEENLFLAEPHQYHEDIKEIDNEREIRRVLNAYVVEEHHEVIPYWFKAANDGIISRYGNTLIHIDGHSDMAPPRYFRKFPFFQWPNNTKQLQYFMQENDMFILSAAISGFISKAVWIWPKWDRENHGKTHHYSDRVDIGWTKIKTRIPNLKRKEFCICSVNELTKNRECVTHPISDEDEEAFNYGVQIKADDCNIQRSILFETYQEESADQLLKTSSLYLKGGGTILDIDEDYYGCTYASQPIRDAGVTLETMIEISTNVSELFCPRNSREELESDRVLVELLQHISNVSCAHDGKSTSGNMCSDPRIIKDVRRMFSNRITKEKSHLICKLDTQDFDKHFQNLINKFKDLNFRQNKALQFVGFCLSMSPKSFDRFSESRFQVCHGSNVREDTAVIEHKPDLAELSWRTRVLGRILSSVKPLNPGVVTVCRSGRDGYTPRELFNQIENDVLKMLKKTFSNVNITYDAGLLGGIKGWPKRYRFL